MYKAERNNKITAIAIAVIMMILCAVLNTVFGFLSLHFFDKDYFDVIESNFKQVKNSVYSLFEQNDSYAKSLEWTLRSQLEAVAQGQTQGSEATDISQFVAVGFLYQLAGGTISNSMDIYTAKDGAIKSSRAQFLQSSILTSLAQGEVIGFLENPDKVFLGGGTDACYFSVARTEQGCIVVVMPLTQVFSLTTDMLILLQKDAGLVLWAVKSDKPYMHKEGFVDKLSGNAKKEINSNGGAFTVSTGFEDKNEVLLTATEWSSAHPNIRAASIIDNSQYFSSRSGMVFRTVMLAVAICVLWLLALLLLLRQSFISPIKFRGGSDTNLIIDFAKDGKIRRTNANFKTNFGSKENLEVIQSTPDLAQSLKAGQPVIFSLTDLGGITRQLLFNPLDTGRYFRTAGCDLTAQINEYRYYKKKDVCDGITRLPLETAFRQQVRERLDRGEQTMATAIFSLTNLSTLALSFKQDTFNQFLQCASKHLSSVLSPFGTLYYMQNGRYIFYAVSGNCQKFAESIQKIMESIKKPINFLDNSICLEVSAGIVVTSAQTQDISAFSLIGGASDALLQAERDKTDYVLLAADSLPTRTNFAQAGAITSMLAAGEIEAYFQPQLSLKTNKIGGFEVLCRIKGDKAKEITIAELINTAENNGGIAELSAYVLDRALSFARQSQAYDVKVSMNVSPVQSLQSGFVQGLLKTVQRYGIKKDIFNIEMSAVSVLQASDDLIDKMNRLRAGGIGVQIDNFGATYSTLNALKKLPVSAIKIDRILLENITGNSDNAVLVKNIIRLVKDLGCEVIIVGAESLQQLELLRALDCDIVQGSTIGKPVSFDQALVLCEH